jgi:hypothetical protein
MQVCIEGELRRYRAERTEFGDEERIAAALIGH